MWWILAGVLITVTALLLCPVTGQLAWEKELTIEVRYLFLKLPLYPAKPKREKKQKQPQQKPLAAEKEKQEKLTAQGIAQLFSMAGAAIKSGKKPFILLLRHLKIKNIRLSVLVSGEDACETALRYGKVNAAVYSAMAAMKNVVFIRNTAIDIRADFTEAEERVSFGGEVSLTPAFALAAGAMFFFSFLKELAEKKKRTNAQQEREKKEGLVSS